MKNKLYFIIVATLLCPTSLYAQSGTDKRSVLSFQTGPTLYTGKLIGIAGYSSNLRNGIGWSGSYTYLVGNKPAIRAGFGILYQGSRYTCIICSEIFQSYRLIVSLWNDRPVFSAWT